MSPPELTRNQELVYETLVRSPSPLSAYGILDELHDRGLRAPQQIYRALDKLTKQGLVHKLQSLNAFVACREPDCHAYASTAFAICDKCGFVSELTNAELEQTLDRLAGEIAFAPGGYTVELRGKCKACR